MAPKALGYALHTEYPIASITSGSMWPALKRGDMVLIEAADKGRLAVGDIVIYKNADMPEEGEDAGFVIHRIVKIDGDVVETKGDANDVSDDPIGYGEIVGKAVVWNGKPLKIPQLGNLTIWMAEMKRK
jgi:signal peptidase I